MIPTTKTILLIDDDALVRETVRLTLAHAGFDVKVLEDLSSPEEAVRREKPDLVLMDLYMPNLDGLELCRRLKHDPATKSIPVVMFTASMEDIDKLSGAEAGAFDYITKPIEPKKLIEKITALLSKNAR